MRGKAVPADVYNKYHRCCADKAHNGRAQAGHDGVKVLVTQELLVNLHQCQHNYKRRQNQRQSGHEGAHEAHQRAYVVQDLVARVGGAVDAYRPRGTLRNGYDIGEFAL